MPGQIRAFIANIFNRGLSIVRPRSLLLEGEASRAENVVFTSRSVKRRNGKLAAYQIANPGTPADQIVTWCRRFYDLATSGTVSKYFLFSFDDGQIYKAGSDWSDATETAVTSLAAGDVLAKPNNTANTLYYIDASNTGYGHTSIAMTGEIYDSFASKSWCYVFPSFTSADDTNDATNVPMRIGVAPSQGLRVYLHGLVPPMSLDTADTVHDPGSATVTWTVEPFSATAAGSADTVSIVAKVSGSSHEAHIAYATATSFRYATNSSGVWVDEEVLADTPALDAGASCAIDLTPQGNPRIALVVDATGTNAGDLMFFEKNRDGAASEWSGFAIETTQVCTAVDMKIDATGKVHVAYADSTAGEVEYAYLEPGSGSWVQEVIDTATSVDVGDYCSIALDSNNAPHVSYLDTTNGNLMYSERTAGTWSTPDVVDSTGTVGYRTSIAIQSDDTVGIAYTDNTPGTVYYVEGTTGSWGSRETVQNPFAPHTSHRSLQYDSDDNPLVAIYLANGTGFMLHSKATGSWDSTVVAADSGSAFQGGALWIDSLDNLHLASGSVSSGFPQYFYGNKEGYLYRLTAEYDDGALGESAPSGITEIATGFDIGDEPGEQSATITLTAADNRYNMTRDVTRINVYRTKKGGFPSDTFYRVGYVTCTAGVPDGDFSDNTNDADLVDGVILDTDKYLPPKYKTGTIWKDRAVIGNLKCRDTSVSTELDYEDGGVHKGRIRFSRAFKPDIFPANYFIDILPDGDSGEIKRLIVNRKIDHLFVFMESDIVALAGDTVLGERGAPFTPRNIQNAKGTPAAYSVVEADGLIFYWTKAGIEVIDAYQGRDITSETIGPLWGDIDSTNPRYADRINMDQISLVRSLYDPKTQRIYWFYPSADNVDNYNDRVLVLDLDLWRAYGSRDGVFSIFTSWNIASACAWHGEGDHGEIFGGESKADRKPWIYRLDFSDEDEGSDADDNLTTTGITSYYSAPLFDFGRPDLYKKFRDMYCAGRSTGNPDAGAADEACTLTIRYVVDEGAGAADLGTAFSFDDSNYDVQRQHSALPRTAIGTRCGFNFTFVDTLSSNDIGPLPWELYDYGMTYQTLTTRRRP